MAKESRQPQKPKQERENCCFTGNIKKRRLKQLRRRSKGSNTFSHAGCPGCEYCGNYKRNSVLRRGFKDEWQY